jgi:hypothetical protein
MSVEFKLSSVVLSLLSCPLNPDAASGPCPHVPT